uniref:ABC transmembrane type-1 domain-containing protein n=1 Tax=Steinernema glaseri TaxID=37863 RepID=A0A1I7YA15_9BILA
MHFSSLKQLPRYRVAKHIDQKFETLQPRSLTQLPSFRSPPNDEVLEFNDFPSEEEPSKKKNRPPKTTLKSLFRFANGVDITLMILGSVLAIGNGLLQPLNTIVTGQIVNVLLNSKPLEGRELWEEARPDVYGFFLLGVIVLLISTLQAICWHMACERQIRRIRNAYLRGVLRQNIGWYDETRSGTLTTQLTDNIDRMKEGMGDKIGVLFQGLAQFGAGFGIAFYYSWKMTLVMLGVIPILVVLAIIMAKVSTVGKTTLFLLSG